MGITLKQNSNRPSGNHQSPQDSKKLNTFAATPSQPSYASFIWMVLSTRTDSERRILQRSSKESVKYNLPKMTSEMDWQVICLASQQFTSSYISSVCKLFCHCTLSVLPWISAMWLLKFPKLKMQHKGQIFEMVEEI